MNRMVMCMVGLLGACVGIAPASTIQIDLNDNDQASPTLTGWQGLSEADTDLGDAWSKNFTGGIALDIDVINGGGDNAFLDDRDRTSQGGGGDGSTDMFRDFMFVASGNTPTEGAELTFTGLAANKLYPVTVWGWDTSSNGTRKSEWSALEGVNYVAKSTYTFDGNGSDPTTLADRHTDFYALSDSSGNLTLRGMAPASGGDGTNNVFINGIELGDPIASSYKIDIDSTDGDGGPIQTAAGWTSLNATGASDSTSVTVDGITFSPFSADGSRIRRDGGSNVDPDALLGDFVFDDGTGEAVGLAFGGAGDLPAGIWQVEMYAYDADFPTGSVMIAGYRRNGSETIVDTSVTFSASGPAITFKFISDGLGAYDVFFRDAPGGATRTRLNAVTLTYFIPTPAALPAGLGLLGLIALRRPRR